MTRRKLLLSASRILKDDQFCTQNRITCLLEQPAQKMHEIGRSTTEEQLSKKLKCIFENKTLSTISSQPHLVHLHPTVLNADTLENSTSIRSNFDSQRYKSLAHCYYVNSNRDINPQKLSSESLSSRKRKVY